jgi:galactonate dehydratase
VRLTPWLPLNAGLNLICALADNTDADLGTYILNPEVFDVKDGNVAVPRGPGLGLEMNEALIRERSQSAVPWATPTFYGPDGGQREW